MSNCACGSEKAYDDCCAPYISGAKKAPTAEALMRSRYTAHTMADMDYIVKTQHEKTRADIDLEQTRSWAEESEWLGLEIVNTEKGQPGDEQGLIEFIAHYIYKGNREAHHEESLFQREGDEWFFLDARAPKVSQVRRSEAKVGRNDPCSCGSGKKYKKCCGKAA